MNIYWCYDPQELWGVYVIAKSRGRAKTFASGQLDIKYIDVRTSIVRKDVKEKQECVVDLGSPLLKKYGLEYHDIEEDTK